MATVLEEFPTSGRPVALERLQSDWKRFNVVIIDGVNVDFDSFGPITHVIKTDSSIVLLRLRRNKRGATYNDLLKKDGNRPS